MAVVEEVSLPKRIFTSVIGWVIAVLISIIFLIFALFRVITKGKEVFQIKKRQKPRIINDPKWGTHRFARLPNQNIKLHYVEKGDKSKPLMLCLHGFPESWFSYRDTLVEFSKDYWVVAVSLRGYGDSDKPASTDMYTLDILVEDIREFIEVLGREKCYLVAHDWGGLIAWTVVHRHPSYFIKHVSMNGPNASAYTELTNSSISQSMKSWYIRFMHFKCLPYLLFIYNDFALLAKVFQEEIKSGHRLTDEELEVYKYYFSLEGAVNGPFSYYRKLQYGSDKLLNMHVNNVETLVIWGSLDDFIDINVVSKMFKYCKKLSVIFLPQAGHFVMQEYPNEVHKHIRSFLEK